ncbi:MAG: hypothetical protein JWO38_388 [Gemmataceae bacterium]|nr:hypothetical protein [Gemmataceae bacterium]
MGITPAEASLFHTIQYRLTLPPSDLPRVASEKFYNYAVPATEEECRAALAACLAKRWLQIVDEAALAEITDDLRKGGVVGPVYGLPSSGEVDFTRTGANLWRLLSDRCSRDSLAIGGPFAYPDVVYEKSARYFRTRTAAAEALEKARYEDDVVSVSGPYRTGPRRAQWLRRFPEGYRIDVEQRRLWQGRPDSGGEDHFLDRDPEKADPQRLEHVLDRHNVTLAEWVLLAGMENGPHSLDCTSLPGWLALPVEPKFGRRISEEEYSRGLDACLRYGWLRVMDRQVIGEVHALLRNDPVLLAIPRTAQQRPNGCSYILDPIRPGQLIPLPKPAESRQGEIDISPAGAALYRMISAEWLGPDWEDDLRFSKVYDWEEHHYCESHERFHRIKQEHLANCEIVRACRVIPIGPWCVDWWEQFPGGYRLELELSDP